jgi:O-antigen/teichoic acid export membrane protein
LAPVLLSRFAKYFASQTEKELLQKKNELSLLIRIEMIAATLVPLILNIIWTPIIDSITGNKYGAVNQWTFLILSFCIPFQYISNLIWSAHFAQNRLKLILRITIITFCITLAGDLIFIPIYQAKGAAFVYLTAIVVEYINYMRSSVLSKIRETWQSLFICMIAAILSGLSAFYFFHTLLAHLVFALPVFFLLLVATRQLQINDWIYISRSWRKKKP